MQKLLISFTKNKRGRKTYNLELTDQEHIKTVFEQFNLSLPLGLKSNQLYVKSFNEINLPIKFRYSYDDLVKAFDNILTNNKLQIMYKNHLADLFVTKQKLTDKDLQDLIHQTGYGYYYIKPYHYYCIDSAKIDLPEDHEDTQDKSQTKNQQDQLPDLTVTDFKTLQKNALLLQSDYQALLNKYNNLNDSIEIMRQITMKSSQDVGQVQDQNAKLTQALKSTHTDQLAENIHDFLASNYQSYLQTDDGCINFIQSLVNNRTLPNVQKLYNYDIQNLLKLIIGVANFNHQ